MAPFTRIIPTTSSAVANHNFGDLTIEAAPPPPEPQTAREREDAVHRARAAVLRPTIVRGAACDGDDGRGRGGGRGDVAVW